MYFVHLSLPPLSCSPPPSLIFLLILFLFLVFYRLVFYLLIIPRFLPINSTSSSFSTY